MRREGIRRRKPTRWRKRNIFGVAGEGGLSRRLFRAVKTLLLLTGPMLLLAGCHTSYVKVDAIARPNAEASIAYRIKTGNPELDGDSLRFKEAEGFVKTALSGKGLYEAPKPELADMIVSLDYGISPPKITKEVRKEAIFRQKPGATHTMSTQSGTDANGNPTYTTFTVQDPPTQVYVGDREYTVTVVTYEKYLRLVARENKAASDGLPPADVWSVDASTEGGNHDLRKALPVLAAATIEFVGKDSQGKKTIRLNDRDQDGPVAFVKKGM